MEELLGSLSEEHYDQFVKLAKQITDFGNEERTQTTGKESELFLTEEESC